MEVEVEETTEDVDVISRIHHEVASLSHMYYNFTGGLQELAPPMSVRGEAVKVESDTSVEYNAQELATQIVDAHKKIDKLIDRLEEAGASEEEDVRSLVDLQERHERMKEAYSKDVEQGDQVFDAIQDCYSLLAEYQLKHGKFDPGPSSSS